MMVHSSRFYKGWYLNEVFDYTRGQSNGTVGTVYAKWTHSTLRMDILYYFNENETELNYN